MSTDLVFVLFSENKYDDDDDAQHNYVGCSLLAERE